MGLLILYWNIKITWEVKIEYLNEVDEFYYDAK